jgi:hypothetical protein
LTTNFAAICSSETTVESHWLSFLPASYGLLLELLFDRWWWWWYVLPKRRLNFIGFPSCLLHTASCLSCSSTDDDDDGGMFFRNDGWVSLALLSAWSLKPLASVALWPWWWWRLCSTETSVHFPLLNAPYWFLAWLTLHHWRGIPHVPPKGLHGVISQKTELLKLYWGFKCKWKALGTAWDSFPKLSKAKSPRQAHEASILTAVPRHTYTNHLIMPVGGSCYFV